MTAEEKIKRTLPSSNYPLSYLSPPSLKACLASGLKERKQKGKAQRYTSYDINVEDATHGELLSLVSSIHHKSQGELEKLLQEADAAGHGAILFFGKDESRMLKIV